MLCLGLKSLVSGEYRGYWGDEIPEGLERLSRARTIIGHNFVEYDRTLIQRLFGITLPLDRIHDTLLASRFVGVPEHEYDVRHGRSEEHTSELQSLMRISYAVVCLKKTKITNICITIRNAAMDVQITAVTEPKPTPESS